MNLMETQVLIVMMWIMLKKDLHLMELTLHLMTSTTSTLPILIETIKTSH